MNRWLNRLVVTVALVLIGATVYGQTITGSRTTDLAFGKFDTDRVEFFRVFDLGTNIGSQTFFVYNDTAGTFGTDTATGGEVPVHRYTESMAVSIGAPIKGSTTIDWQIEGRFGTATEYSLIASGTIDTATTINEVIPIAENPESIRVGLKSVTEGIDSVNVYGLFRRLK